jgi:hypothetical protein
VAQPAVYNRQYDLTDYATLHPDDAYQPAFIDAELDAIELTLDAVLANLALIQRDDTLLANGAVHPDALSTATKALIASDWTPKGLWVTATAYVVGDVVERTESGVQSSYVCAVAHTSGTFATDWTAGKWIVLGTYVSGGASSISFAATGTIAATNVQAAIAEVAADALQRASNLSDLASPSASRRARSCRPRRIPPLPPPARPTPSPRPTRRRLPRWRTGSVSPSLRPRRIHPPLRPLRRTAEQSQPRRS